MKLYAVYGVRQVDSSSLRKAGRLEPEFDSI